MEQTDGRVISGELQEIQLQNELDVKEKLISIAAMWYYDGITFTELVDGIYSDRDAIIAALKNE